MAGPYRADTQEGIGANVRRAVAAGNEIIQVGQWPLIPHTSMVYDIYREELGLPVLDFKRWMEWSYELLSHCDALYFLAESEGANLELQFALRNNMPVFLSIQEIMEHVCEECGKLFGEEWDCDSCNTWVDDHREELGGGFTCDPHLYLYRREVEDVFAIKRQEATDAAEEREEAAIGAESGDTTGEVCL